MRRHERMAAYLAGLFVLGTTGAWGTRWRPQLRDPADEMVLETALNGRANVLVTLNIGDFAAAERFRLKVATPGAFLRQLQEEKT